MNVLVFNTCTAKQVVYTYEKLKIFIRVIMNQMTYPTILTCKNETNGMN
jgi:hypothetical protein